MAHSVHPCFTYFICTYIVGYIVSIKDQATENERGHAVHPRRMLHNRVACASATSAAVWPGVMVGVSVAGTLRQRACKRRRTGRRRETCFCKAVGVILRYIAHDRRALTGETTRDTYCGQTLVIPLVQHPVRCIRRGRIRSRFAQCSRRELDAPVTKTRPLASI